MTLPGWTTAAVLLGAVACGSRGEVEAREGPAPAGATSTGVVRLERGLVEREGIHWRRVEKTRLARSLVVSAEVTLDPDRTAHVGPLAEGRVTRVVAREGDRVTRGATLAVVASVASVEDRAALARARTELDLASAQLRREQELHAAGLSATREREEAAAAVRRAEISVRAARQRSGLSGEVQLKSPIAGTVIERSAAVGQTLDASSRAFVVADLSRVWVVGRVHERDTGAVREGASALVTVPAHPGREWRGTVSRVASALEPATRTLSVRVELENADETLRPGSFGTLALEVGDAAERIAVESVALQRIGSRSVVFRREALAGPLEQFVAIDVTPGESFGKLVELRSGVSPGDEIVFEGAFTLKGQLLRGSLVEGD